MSKPDNYTKQIDTNANEDEEVLNALSAGEEEPLENPDTLNTGGTGSGVTPVSDITGHARGDTRPVIGHVPLGAESPLIDSNPEDQTET